MRYRCTLFFVTTVGVAGAVPIQRTSQLVTWRAGLQIGIESGHSRRNDMLFELHGRRVVGCVCARVCEGVSV